MGGVWGAVRETGRYVHGCNVEAGNGEVESSA